MSRLADEGDEGDEDGSSAFDGAMCLRRLLFADFLVPGAEPRRYEEVTDFDRLTSVVSEYLADLNAGAASPRLPRLSIPCNSSRPSRR
jgi:dynein heavy chain